MIQRSLAMTRKFIASLLKQLFIFLSYFIASSTILFNHQGGADMLFIFLISLASVIHLITTLLLFLFYKQKPVRKWNKLDLMTLSLILLCFVLIYPFYLKFMWAFSSSVQ